MEQLSQALKANRERVAAALRWPGNIGVIFRELTVASQPPASALLIWIAGVASAKAVAATVVGPLTRPQAAASIRTLASGLPVAQHEATREVQTLLERVNKGWTALLVDGIDEALLVDTAAPQHGDASDTVYAQRFGPGLTGNIGMLRTHLPSSGLLAQSVDLRVAGAGPAAIVYREGRAAPAVVRHVRRWVAKHVGQDEARRGDLTGRWAASGLLPRFEATRWVDRAAILLDAGYVAVVLDRMPYVYIAPVTLASFMLAPSDVALRFPVQRWLIRLRLCLYFLVTLLPGAVVAVLNYHQEMVPTGFILAVASARESAPFPAFFEVLLLELLTELTREAGLRMPDRLPMGAATIATLLIVVLMVLTGFVGPLAAMAAVAGALAVLGLPSYGGAYLARYWRYLFMIAASILGFFGMAALFAVLLAYLCQATSWGVPFLGPAGEEMSGPEARSARAPEMKGGKRRATRQAHVR